MEHPILNRLVGQLGRRVAAARFMGFLLLFVATAAAVANLVGPLRAILCGFDVAATLFIASLLPLLRARSATMMRSHVHPNDADRRMLLVVTVAVMLVILTTVAGVLNDRGTLRPPTAVLLVATLGLCWLFSNCIYALHYAHLYYHRDAAGRDTRGLLFPDTQEPDYVDFIYFAFTIGMTFQTSDVQICTRRIRVVVTFHALAAFVFNIGILAFSINVLGSGHG